MGQRDRRHTRRRAFRSAAAAVGVALAVAVAALLAGWPSLALLAVLAGLGAALALLRRPGGVPILVYHSVSPDASWLPWSGNTTVRPETLRRHLETLRADGWTVVPTGALIDARRGGAPLPAKAVVLHFDDCYLDNFLFAAPLLREFAAPAMFFASLDFIEPGDALRTDAVTQGGAAWRGYMTARELRAMDADPLFDIEAHGVDHARIPVSTDPVETATPENWRRHAPLAWALQPGNKARWFEATTPPAILAPGTPIPRSDSALAGRWLQGGIAETEAAFAARVGAALRQAHAGLQAILGRPPRVFCWPFDRSDPASVAAAHEAGFEAVTGGRGENRPDESGTVLSRIHVQDHAFGGGPLWLEALALRARVGTAAGLLHWYPVMALASRKRRRRFRQPGYAAPS